MKSDYIMFLWFFIVLIHGLYVNYKWLSFVGLYSDRTGGPTFFWTNLYSSRWKKEFREKCKGDELLLNEFKKIEQLFRRSVICVTVSFFIAIKLSHYIGRN